MADAYPIELRVYGVPQPQGSKRVGRHGRHPVILDANDGALRPWRYAVTCAARELIDSKPTTYAACPLDGPLALLLVFTLPRPKSAPKSRRYPDRKPDLSKLVRAVEDALTDAALWRDDAQVITTTATKRYVGDAYAMPSPGVEIGVTTL